MKASEIQDDKLDHARINRYLFIRIPRTASTSIDWVIKGNNRHVHAKEYKKRLKNDWHYIFKFAICRNPYTRFVSAYNALTRETDDINDYLAKGGIKSLVKRHGFEPQYKYLYDKGECIVDYVGRFEKLRSSWKYIKNRIGFEHRNLPHLAGTEKKYLNKESKRIIYKYYKKDFDLLCYSS